MYPREFEYYFIALELVNFNDETIDYFGFPIMPSSITKTDTNRVNIKKGFNSVIVLNNKSFSPQEISIKGTFGRDFKIMINPLLASRGTAINFSTRNGVYSLDDMDPQNTANKKPVFSPYVKTGYGATKILQAIINKASGEDEKGRPFRLYFYNPALGENYLVMPPQNALILSQDNQQGNMIWSYSLNLTILSPIDYLKEQSNSNSITNILEQQINTGTRKLRNTTSKFLSNVLVR
jgi:hypothetical protein